MGYFDELYTYQRNRKFSDIYPDFTAWTNAIEASPIPLSTAISATNLELLYWLLMSRYKNSTIASNDETRFELDLFTTIYSTAPAFFKKLEIQTEIRDLNIDELVTASKVISNHAYNPDTEPLTSSTEALPRINEQNYTTSQRDIASGYALLLALLEDDLIEPYLNRFRLLFITFVDSEVPIWF